MKRIKLKNGLKSKAVVIASGFFNPLHKGHVRYLKEARKLGKMLIVIVNNDEQVKIKGSKPFMEEKERVEIVSSLACVNMTILSVDDDGTVERTIKYLVSLFGSNPDSKIIFAKGGDSIPENVPELEICKSNGVEVIFGVGGEKSQSSSWLLNLK